jgi:quinohemoprotein ethanol dehydrogenase
LTFRLGGSASLPPPPAPPAGAATATARRPKLEGEAKRGEGLYAANCAVCHGVGAVSGGVLPDLRELSDEVSRDFDAIVLGGARTKQGMPSFSKRLTKEDVAAIQAYLARQRAAAQARAFKN